jgi:alkanesulfonate monooxygenase SsuD/methylene tetrahydromethanopterin reductase-like flavin-dependent oxidoreductase (luciferase family)
MPLVTTPIATGRLGFLLPPMPPLPGATGSGGTQGTTMGHTFGSTNWVTSLASAAETAGAAGVWATDHLFWTRPFPECLTTLAVAAAATGEATVGACVLQLPLRAPAVVAKQAAALQVLSGGRFVLGVGVGNHEGEYDLAGVPFHTRGKALDAGIEAMRAAWRTAGESGHYRLEPCGTVPVWVGGASDAAIGRAAAVGDGWVPLFLDPEEFAAALGRLREAAAAAGRGPDAVVPAVVMVASVGDDPQAARASGTAWLSALYGIPAKAFDRHLVAGSAEHCADVALDYVAAGAAHVIVLVAADDALGSFRPMAAAYNRLATRTTRRQPASGPDGGARRWARTDDMAGVGA